MSTTSVDVHQDPHGHGGEHDPHFQHHFTTMEQQFDTSKIGMWLFLVTEVLTFGGLFAGFGLMQNRYPQEFVAAHEELKRWAGATNTVVLLVSSFTAVMAVLMARTNQGNEMRDVPVDDRRLRRNLHVHQSVRVLGRFFRRPVSG